MAGMVASCGPGSLIQINTPVPNTQAGTPAPSGQVSVPGISKLLYAPGVNPAVNTADAQGRIAGIWTGIYMGPGAYNMVPDLDGHLARVHFSGYPGAFDPK